MSAYHHAARHAEPKKVIRRAIVESDLDSSRNKAGKRQGALTAAVLTPAHTLSRLAACQAYIAPLAGTKVEPFTDVALQWRPEVGLCTLCVDH